MKIEGTGLLARIYIGESDTWHGRPLYEAIVHLLRERGLAGATVLRGIEGFGARQHLHTTRILSLSSDLPVLIEVGRIRRTACGPCCRRSMPWSATGSSRWSASRSSPTAAARRPRFTAKRRESRIKPSVCGPGMADPRAEPGRARTARTRRACAPASDGGR